MGDWSEWNGKRESDEIEQDSDQGVGTFCGRSSLETRPVAHSHPA